MKSHSSIQQIDGNDIVTIDSGNSISSNTSLAIDASGALSLDADGYINLTSKGDGNAISLESAADLSLVATKAGSNVLVAAGPNGEIRLLSDLVHRGDTAQITLSSGSIVSTGPLVLTAAGESNDVDISAGNGGVSLTATAAPGIQIASGSSSIDMGYDSNVIVTATSDVQLIGTNVEVTGALAVTASSGHAVSITGDTTSPTSSALAITTQDSEPGSGALGDVYVHSSGLMSSFYDDGYWGGHVHRVHALDARVTREIPADTTAHVVNFTIPANQIRAGSTIRVYAAGEHDDCIGLPSPRLTIGGVAPSNWLLQATNTANNRHVIDATITVRSVGASAALFMSVLNDAFNNTTYNRRFFLETYTIDTTTDWSIVLEYGCGEGGCDVGVDQFIVEISD